MNKKLLDYVDVFALSLVEQLKDDEKRWGDTWRNRPLEGQEDRIMEHIMSYHDQFKYGGQKIPWLKIAGLALIAWVRETYPEELNLG